MSGAEPAIPPPEVVRRSLRGLGWTALGTGGQAAAQLGVLVVLARLLAPEDFGVVTAAAALTGFGLIFANLGVGPAIIQRRSLTDAHLRTGLTVSLTLGLALGAGVAACARPLAELLWMPDAARVISIIALTLPLHGAGVVAVSLLQRRLAFRSLAVVQLVSFLLGYGLVAIVLSWLGAGAQALAAASVAQAALQTVLALALARPPLALSIDGKALGELSNYGGGLTLGRIGNYVALQADNLVVARLLGAAALGVYSRAYQITTLPASLFSKVVDGVLFPALSAVQDDTERVRDAFLKGSVIVALMTLPASAVGVILAPEIVIVALGEKWAGAILPLQILLASMWLRTSYKMSDSLARSSGHVWRRAWRQVVYAAAVIAGAAVGARWGIAGVAAGVSLAIAVNFVAMTDLSLRTLGLSWRRFAAVHGPPMLSALVAAFGAGLAALVGRGSGWAPAATLVAGLAVVSAAAALALCSPWLMRLFVGPHAMRFANRLFATALGRSS